METQHADLPELTADVRAALEIRAKIRPLLEAVCEVITEARREDGLSVGFNISPDQHGISRVMVIDVIKAL